MSEFQTGDPRVNSTCTRALYMALYLGKFYVLEEGDFSAKNHFSR
jgi:hypothetical protein